MAQRNLRNLLVPAPGDPILTSLSQTLAEAGVYVPVASAAAARLLLTQMETAGQTPTPATPLMLLVGSGAQRNAYIADGSKNSGTWVLQALNEVEVDEQTYSRGTTGTIGDGMYSNMITSALPARPYDRVMTAVANAYGNITGNVDLCLQDGGTDISLARWSSGDRQSATVTNSGIIPANTAPAIRVGIRGGGPSGGSVSLTSDSRLNRLVVVAYPITMSV